MWHATWNDGTMARNHPAVHHPPPQQQEVYCVTGATGFLGSHCVKLLLESGRRVRATVRDPGSKKAQFLKELPGAAERLALVKADLLDSVEDWRGVVRGCAKVLHTASPFQAEGNFPEEYFVRPAVQGTEAVLGACIKEGVRRVVLTSSVVAIAYGRGSGPENPYFSPPGLDEGAWTPIEGLRKTEAYNKSKTLAERRAWELVEGTATELAVVNPVLIVGPLLADTGGEASRTLVRAMMRREYPGIPAFPIHLVDVRDVAKMHVRLADSPTAAGQRHICSSTALSITMGAIASTLAAHYNPQGWKVPTRRLPAWILKIAAVFDGKLGLLMPSLGRTQYLVTDRGTRAVGGSWVPWQQSVVDMAESMIALKIISKPQARGCL